MEKLKLENLGTTCTDINLSQREVWIDVYVRSNFKDPHTEFANRLGMDRQEAKVLCYKISCSVLFIRNLIPKRPRLLNYVSLQQTLGYYD